MPKLSGVKAARAIWRDFPTARIIFWTQFPHEIYINEIRKIVKAVDPPPAYGFIHKNNPESRFLRFVAAVLEDGADMRRDASCLERRHENNECCNGSHGRLLRCEDRA